MRMASAKVLFNARQDILTYDDHVSLTRVPLGGELNFRRKVEANLTLSRVTLPPPVISTGGEGSEACVAEEEQWYRMRKRSGGGPGERDRVNQCIAVAHNEINFWELTECLMCKEGVKLLLRPFQYWIQCSSSSWALLSELAGSGSVVRSPPSHNYCVYSQCVWSGWPSEKVFIYYPLPPSSCWLGVALSSSLWIEIGRRVLLLRW